MFWQENNTFNALPLLAGLQMANVVKGEALSGWVGCRACHSHQRGSGRGLWGQGWRVKAVLHRGLVREWALSGGPRRSPGPSISSLGPRVPSPSHKSLLLWGRAEEGGGPEA